MKYNKLNKDIQILGDIFKELVTHYSDNDWDLCDFHKDELYRITGIEEHDWDENNLTHYIDGMRRAIKLLRDYNE